MCVCVCTLEAVLVNMGTPECTDLCVYVCIDTCGPSYPQSRSLSRGLQVHVAGWLARLVRVRATPVSSPHPQYQSMTQPLAGRAVPGKHAGEGRGIHIQSCAFPNECVISAALLPSCVTARCFMSVICEMGLIIALTF